MVFPTINQGQDYIDRGLQSDEERAREGEARGPIGPSERIFCRVRRPIAEPWGKKTVKGGPLRRFAASAPSPTGCYWQWFQPRASEPPGTR